MPHWIYFVLIVGAIVGGFVVVTSLWGESTLPFCGGKPEIKQKSCPDLEKFIEEYNGELQPDSALNLNSKIYSFLTVSSEGALFPMNLSSCKLEFDPKNNEEIFKAHALRAAYERSGGISFEDSAHCFALHNKLPETCSEMLLVKEISNFAEPASYFVGSESNISKLLKAVRKLRTAEASAAIFVIENTLCTEPKLNLFAASALINNIRCPLSDIGQGYFYSGETESFLEASQLLVDIYNSEDFNKHFVPSVVALFQRDCSQKTLRKTNLELGQILELVVDSWVEPQQRFQETIKPYRGSADVAVSLMDANITKAEEAFWAKFMLTKIAIAYQNPKDSALRLYDQGLFPLAEKEAIRLSEVYENWDAYTLGDWLSLWPLDLIIILSVAVFIWWRYW